LTEIHKILVVRLSSIGDIILTTPLLRSLRTTFPKARITFLIKKQYEELLNHSPYVDELITFEKSKGYAALRDIKNYLKGQQVDVFIDIHKNWRSRYLKLFLNVRKTTGYPKMIFKRTLLIVFRINLYRKIIPVYQRYFESVRHLGIQYDGKGTTIHFPPEKEEEVRKMLSSAGYAFDTPLVVICPSATYFNKRWKPEGFVETAKTLIRERSAFVVIHGGREDIPLCTRIASSIGNRAVSMAGLLSLSGSAALLGFSSVVIANDSGLLHLAQSQKKPVVGIYGATTRELGYFPIEANSTVIETDLPCRPCTHNGLDHCPKKHFRCMNDIPAERVIQAALRYLI